MALIIDVPPAWEGLYVGAHVGGAWNTATVDDHYDYVGYPVSSNNLNGGGIIGGGQIGYNFQWGNIVLAQRRTSVTLAYPEADRLRRPRRRIVWRTTRETCAGSMRIIEPPGGLYGDITGCLGYAVDRVLFYAKGARLFGRRHKLHRAKLFYRTQLLSASECAGERVHIQLRTKRNPLGLDGGRRHRIRIEPGMVRQGRIPALRFRKRLLQTDGTFDIPGTPWRSILRRRGVLSARRRCQGRGKLPPQRVRDKPGVARKASAADGFLAHSWGWGGLGGACR